MKIFWVIYWCITIGYTLRKHLYDKNGDMRRKTIAPTPLMPDSFATF